MPCLFALDQNFPAPIVNVLTEYQEDAELVRLGAIDSRLTDLDDWEVLLALHHHASPWDGLITADTTMLNQPLELVVLIQTKLTLVNVRAAGHDPVKASGLLFVYLGRICKRTRADRGQIWSLAAGNKEPSDPWDALKSVANHQNVDASELFSANRLNEEGLAHDPLSAPRLGD